MTSNEGAHNKKKLWIVDDEPALSQLYMSYFTRFYEVEAFTSALQAIDALKKKRVPDVILSDMKMPEMDGLTFVKTLREVGFSMPIVMISGYAEKDHILQALNSRVEKFVEKPCSPSDVKAAIDSVLLVA